MLSKIFRYLILLIPFFYFISLVRFLKLIGVCLLIDRVKILAISIFTLPVALGLYTGNIAILFSIFMIEYFISIIARNKIKNFVCEVFLGAIKVTLFPVFILNLVYNDSIKLRSITARGIKLIGAIVFVQTLSYLIISHYLDEAYSYTKIITSIFGYKDDYVAGAHGISSRYWFGTLWHYLNKISLINKAEANTIFIVVTVLLLVGLIYSFVKNKSIIVKINIFLIGLFYINLSTTVYWYAALVPLFIIVIRSNLKIYSPELWVLCVIMLPKPIFTNKYALLDNLIVMICIWLYVFYRSMVFCKVDYQKTILNSAQT